LELSPDQFRQCASLGIIRVSKKDKTLARLAGRLSCRVMDNREVEFYLTNPTPIERNAVQCLLGRWIKTIGWTSADAQTIIYWRFHAGAFITNDSEEIERLAVMDDEPMKRWKAKRKAA
jgi:hypothetical protein